MRLSFVLLILTTLACIHFTRACDPAQSQHGCKIYGVSCTCGYGCKTEFMYKSRRACLSALRERGSNVCYRMPCLRGICIQTVQEPGFTCKCEGTGFFGFRCEKACPTVLTRGMIFPHECIEAESSSPSVCHVSGGLVSKLCIILRALPSLPDTETMKPETQRKVSAQYNCAGWCTRINSANAANNN